MALWEHLRSYLHPHSYLFWLLTISLLVLIAERVRPWRREQRWLRPELGQDLLYLTINGHLFGLAVAWIFSMPFVQMYRGADWWCLSPDNCPSLIAAWPLRLQFIVFLVWRDLLEFGVHNLLHKVPLLWRFHRLHHSIREMDWIGNFRFHWMEIVIYDALKWLPLVVLGAHWSVLLAVGVVSTCFGHLNHANLRISWGPLRYVFNSPCMHIHHHDVKCRRRRHGQNFAVVFSCWDWLFGTAWWPADQEHPDRIGFAGQRRWYPRAWWTRLAEPFLPRWQGRNKRADAKASAGSQ